MKLFHAAALALFAVAPAVASASEFLVYFENAWSYGTDINGYYSGGTAADGSAGADLGVSFVGVSGLSNDADFTYYDNAPSPLGTAYAHTFAEGDAAYINVADGVSGALTFYYSTPVSVVGAVKAYSGANGTGTLLGSFDLVANSGDGYDGWTAASFYFGGFAQSFDITASANVVGFDNIGAVPEPAAAAMCMAGGLLLLGMARARRR